MLKEQVAEILTAQFMGIYTTDVAIKRGKELTGLILNLFKAEVDKLTEIDDEDKFHCSLPSKYSFGEVKGVIDETAIWQLEDIQKQLLDLMGE